jgi:SM-20-related protein
LNYDAPIDALVAKGWAVIDNFFDANHCRDLKKSIIEDEKSGLFKKAGVGRGNSYQVDSTLRADYIRWIDDYDGNAAIDAAKKQIDELRVGVNRTLFLGLNDFEGHLTIYPEGNGYTKHVDRFQDNNARTLSFVCYLNEDWTNADGGTLKIYSRDDSEDLEAEVSPILGRAVVFLSADIYHAVSANNRPRYSLTGWFRR